MVHLFCQNKNKFCHGSFSPLFPPNPKEKKKNPFEPSHWLHEFIFSKMVHQHFQLGLIPLFKMKVLIMGYDS
jgi:hypothetical protein